MLVLTAIGSSRNYGVRYLLPVAPLAIVWISALAERGAWPRRAGWAGLVGYGIAVASCHPHELSYFNALGRSIGGYRVLSDSNLDWGQGARQLARLQRAEPEFRDMTLYYFGDTDPVFYGVVGTRYLIDAHDREGELPARLESGRRYLAVSRSLVWGPWGPPCYFNQLRGLEPRRLTADDTIVIFETPENLRPAKGRRAQ
jgi:hypothetical protein